MAGTQADRQKIVQLHGPSSYIPIKIYFARIRKIIKLYSYIKNQDPLCTNPYYYTTLLLIAPL